MSDLFPITRADMIAEIEREIVLRQRVYPRWVGSSRLTRAKADRQIAIMQAVLKAIYEMKP